MTIPRRGAAAVVAVAAVALLTSACTGSSGTKSDPATTAPALSTSPAISSPTTTPTPSPSTTDPAIVEANLEQTLDQAWVAYWNTTVTVTSYPRSQWKSRIAAVSVDPIYSEAVNSITAQFDALGEVGYGYIVSRPYWITAPKPGQKTVVMGDCFDGTHTGSKVAKTGQVKTVGEARTNVHVTLVLGAGAKWRVMQIEYLKASC